MKNYVAYVGSYSYTGKAKDITIFDVDVECGSFKKHAEVEVDNASSIVVSSDRRMLYAMGGYGMVALRILSDGGLVRVSSEKVNDMRPHHICVDQESKYLYTSSYHDGKPMILRLDPGDAVGPVMDEVYHKGLGSIAEHGSRTHIICSELICSMCFVMSTDPGIDQVSTYRFTGRPREIRPVDATRTARDSSPCLSTFSENDRFLYLLFGMMNTIDMYHYTVSKDKGMSEFTKLQTICATGDNASDSLSAATHMTFIAHDHYIFVGNVGDDNVTFSSRDVETGLLTAEFNLPISDEYLKGAAVFPGGQHIMSMNHESGTLSFFRVDYEKKLIVVNIDEILVSQLNCCIIVLVGEDTRMVGSIFGALFRVSTLGKSHGTALDAVIDGCPAGPPLSAEEIQTCLNRRKPGQSVLTTPRKGADTCKTLSGVFEGKILGTPIAVLVWNKDQCSAGYQAIRDRYRPGHANFGFDRKFDLWNPWNDGRSSRRETIGRVIGSTIATKFLAEFGIRALAYVSAVGAIEIATFDETICAENLFDMPDPEAAVRTAVYLKEVMQVRGSLGGTVSRCVTGMFPGLDKPVFDKLDAEFAEAIMSIGAVKGVGFGDGFGVSTRRGSEDSDTFCPGWGGTERKGNHTGGTFDGISDSSDILFRAVVKAAPSIGSPRGTVNKNGEPVTIEIQGRHDPTTMPRATVVVESMVNLVLTDLFLRNSVSTVERLRRAVDRT